MKRSLLTITTLFGVLLAGAAGVTAKAPAPTQSAATEAFKHAIRHLYDIKEKAWAAGDAETIVTRFYSADAVSVGEGEPQTMIGRAAFRKAYQQYVQDVSSVRIESVKSYVNGNAGWDLTNFYHTPKPGKEKDYPPSPLRIAFLWAKEGGTWVCKGEFFVSGKFANPLLASSAEH